MTYGTCRIALPISFSATFYPVHTLGMYVLHFAEQLCSVATMVRTVAHFRPIPHTAAPLRLSQRPASCANLLVGAFGGRDVGWLFNVMGETL